MSTDLPEDAIDLGVHESIVWPEGEAVKTHLPGPHRIVAIPVPDPEPPTLAERIDALFQQRPVTRTPYLSMGEVGVWEWIASARDLLSEAAAVCRDDAPTETQREIDVLQAELATCQNRSIGLVSQRDDAREHVALLEEELKLLRPTVTQVMKALGFRRLPNGAWWTPDFSSYPRTVEAALTSIGAARPDQEPDT